MNSKLLHIVSALLLGSPFITHAQDRPFSHLDLSLTGGTTGIGVDISTNITDWMRLRTGFDAMPRFEQDVHFTIASMDESGNLSNNFYMLNEKLKAFTGYEASDYVDMTCKPTFYNFKFLLDFHPFKRNQSFLKNVSFTAGFYWGSSEIARAVNTVEGAQTLNGLMMYNHLYNVALSGEPLVVMQVEDWVTHEIVDQPIYLDDNLCAKLIEFGRMGAPFGNYVGQYLTDADGNVLLDENGEKRKKPYLMEPDHDGTVRARVKANSFKPYLGVGYEGRLLKNNNRYHISADLGLLFWGGKPSIIAHDGVDLAHDVENIGGKVGDYIDFISGLHVYPVLNFRFSYTLF